MTEFLTDGTHLFEVAARRTVQNFGTFERSKGRVTRVIRYVILRDCVSEACATVDELDLAALTPVKA